MPFLLFPVVKTSKLKKIFPSIRRQRNYILDFVPIITQNNRHASPGAASSSILLPCFSSRSFLSPMISDCRALVKGCRGTYLGQSILSPRETIIISILKEVSEISISVTKSTRNSGTAASEKFWYYYEVKITQSPHKNLNCTE